MSDTKLSTIGEAFCVAPLPSTVAADLCATDASYPHPRYGTHLLSVTEAQRMLGPLVWGMIEEAFREGHRAARIRYAPAEPNGPTRFENVDWEYAPLRSRALSGTPSLATPANSA